MLISDVRKEIKKYNRNELENIIVELYKKIPKNKKEEYFIDDMITDFNASIKKEKNEVVDFESLNKEITYFLSCVDNGLYASANRIISKKERSAWRFKVKKFYKALIATNPSDLNGPGATYLLIEIFKRLSRGCESLLFASWNTFGALGVSQNDYYNIIMQRIFYAGINKDNLSTVIDLLDLPTENSEFCYISDIFINYIKNKNEVYLAISLFEEKINKYVDKYNNIKKGQYDYKYFLKYSINNYVEYIAKLYFNLNEIQTGIDFFKKHYLEEHEEYKIRKLLSLIESFNFNDFWVLEYEKYMNKFKFSDYFIDKYNKLKSKKNR